MDLTLCFTSAVRGEAAERRDGGLRVGRLPAAEGAAAGAAAARPAARRLRRRQARVQLQAQARHVRHQAQVHAAQEGVPLLVSVP